MPIPETEPNNFGGSDEEGQLSARSRFTTASNVTTITNKSKRREHKLGCEYIIKSSQEITINILEPNLIRLPFKITYLRIAAKHCNIH